MLITCFKYSVFHFSYLIGFVIIQLFRLLLDIFFTKLVLNFPKIIIRQNQLIIHHLLPLSEYLIM